MHAIFSVFPKIENYISVLIYFHLCASFCKFADEKHFEYRFLLISGYPSLIARWRPQITAFDSYVC